MIRRHAPIWNVMLLLVVIGAALIVFGSVYGWTNFTSCYLPIILYVAASVCMGIQRAMDKYGPAWRETEHEKSCLTFTREVPDTVDGEVCDVNLLDAPAPQLPARSGRKR